MRPITKEDLENFTCSEPGCTEPDHDMYLHQICHHGAGVYLRYPKGTGHLVVTCKECEVQVALVAVASKK